MLNASPLTKIHHCPSPASKFIPPDLPSRSPTRNLFPSDWQSSNNSSESIWLFLPFSPPLKLNYTVIDTQNATILEAGDTISTKTHACFFKFSLSKHQISPGLLIYIWVLNVWSFHPGSERNPGGE